MLVVGAGGAGLRATFGLAQKGLKTARITKVFPTRSHTVAAQGGISAALGNMGEDDWRFHFYDTIKGSGLAGRPGRDRVHVPRGDPGDHRAGTPGRAVQPHRRGQDLPAPVRRHDHPLRRRASPSAPAPPPTAPATRSCTPCTSSRCARGAVLHRVFRAGPDHGRRRRLPRRAGLDMAEGGTLHLFRAQGTVLATGGYGRAYFSATSAHTCTGDGGGMAHGAGLADAGHGVRAVPPDRHLRRRLPDHRGRARRRRHPAQSAGERFMERYAPNAKDLASRDVVSRAR